jgi:hypothetical protein
MKTTIFKNDMLTTLALLLSLPTAYLILVAVLKYGLGIDGPFDAIQPTAEKWGIKESPGLNITSLILFGPVAAFVLAVFQFIKIESQSTREEWLFHVTVQRRWFPLLVAVFSMGLLSVLFLYMLGENCNCH